MKTDSFSSDRGASSEAATVRPSAYPCTCVAHWSTGPVPCCDDHARGLVGLGRFMGLHVAVTAPAPEGAECENCKNSTKKTELRDDDPRDEVTA
jgi:hypothetical protein